MNDLMQRQWHFEFGANWADFARDIDDARIESAERCLHDLVGGNLKGCSFLDIGCGSGLSALAAIRLGASRVRAVDLDEKSVATTRTLLAQYAPEADWVAETASVFDLEPSQDGYYDMVHSWGVLHHTGDMVLAIWRASRLVRLGGRFVFAIYQRTPSCDFWRWEKRYYHQAPSWTASLIRCVYKTVFVMALIATRRNPARYIRDYRCNRGMRWSNDVHDWLGGYPYESASEEEIDAIMTKFGFIRESANLLQRSLGILGSGCNEYVYRRVE